jgi:hypothetical protein
MLQRYNFFIEKYFEKEVQEWVALFKDVCYIIIKEKGRGEKT